MKNLLIIVLLIAWTIIKLHEDSIEFAKDIIKDVLQLKYLDKICHELNISCEVAFVNDTGN
jgi:hypothetical protein